jgi:hypothetical protein
MNRRLRFLPGLTALVLAVGVAATTGAATAASAAAKATPSFCTHSGPIPASAISSPLDLRNCPIVGRLIVRSNGTNMGLHVPRPGLGVGAYALTKTGDYVLTATNVNGRLTISTSAPAARTPKAAILANPAAAAADPACNELAVAYTGKLWNKTLNWYYNQSTVSRAGLDGPTTRDDMRQANANITLGMNNCGYSETGFRAYGAYQGTTSLFANINSAAQCTSKFPDGQNTNSWGPFDSNHAGTLALTCWAWNTGSSYTTEADTYLGSNRGLVTSFSPFCTSSYDMETVMTHEWGHSYGLAHETAGPHEVMYPYVTPCALRRHLGHGDYAGMANLYGLR